MNKRFDLEDKPIMNEARLKPATHASLEFRQRLLRTWVKEFEEATGLETSWSFTPTPTMEPPYRLNIPELGKEEYVYLNVYGAPNAGDNFVVVAFRGGQTANSWPNSGDHNFYLYPVLDTFEHLYPWKWKFVLNRQEINRISKNAVSKLLGEDEDIDIADLAKKVYLTPMSWSLPSPIEHPASLRFSKKPAEKMQLDVTIPNLRLKGRSVILTEREMSREIGDMWFVTVRSTFWMRERHGLNTTLGEVFFYIHRDEFPALQRAIEHFWTDDIPTLVTRHEKNWSIEKGKLDVVYQRRLRRSLKSMMAGNVIREMAEKITAKLGVTVHEAEKEMDVADFVHKSVFVNVHWKKTDESVLTCVASYPLLDADGYVTLQLLPYKMEDEYQEPWFHVTTHLSLRYGKDKYWQHYAESRYTKFYILASELQPLKDAIENFLKVTVYNAFQKRKQGPPLVDFKKSLVSKFHKAIKPWRSNSDNWDYFYLLHLPEVVKTYEAKHGPLDPKEKEEWRQKAIAAGTPLPEGW